MLTPKRLFGHPSRKETPSSAHIGAPELHSSRLNGNGAVCHVAEACSDIAFVYPLLPDAYEGDLIDTWNHKNQESKDCLIQTMDTTIGAGQALLGALSTGSSVSVACTSESLIHLTPNLHAIAARQLPCVIHCAVQGFDADSLSTSPDYRHILSSVTNPRLGIIHSETVQECHDMAVISQIASKRLSTPFIHFYDGHRTASETVDSNILGRQAIDELCSSTSVPTVSKLHRLPSIPRVVDAVMEQCAPLFNRRYRLFEYTGSFNAQSVVIALCSADDTQTLSEGVRAHLESHSDVGLLTVRLLRPWSPKHLLQVLPSSVRRVAIVTTSSAKNTAELYANVAATMNMANRRCKIVTAHLPSGLTQWTVTASVALFTQLNGSAAPPSHFVPVLPQENTNVDEFPEEQNHRKPEFIAPPADNLKVLVWDIDETSADSPTQHEKAPYSKNESNTLGLLNNLIGDFRVHSITQTDATLRDFTAAGSSKKPDEESEDKLKGIVRATHVHISRSSQQNLVNPTQTLANYVVVNNVAILEHYNVVAQLRQGGSLLLNTVDPDVSIKGRKLLHELPLDCNSRKIIRDKNIDIYTLDSHSITKAENAPTDKTFLDLALFQLFPDHLALPPSSFSKSLGVGSDNVHQYQKSVNEHLLHLNYQSPKKIREEKVELRTYEADYQVDSSDSDLSSTPSSEAPLILPSVIEKTAIIPAATIKKNIFTDDEQESEIKQITNSSQSSSSTVAPQYKAAWQLLFPEAYGVKEALRPNHHNTFVIKCTENTRLTPDTYARNVFHIDFDLSGTGLKYEIGDALGVFGHNDPEQIEHFMEWYGLNPTDLVLAHLPKQDKCIVNSRTVEQVLIQELDILGRPSKKFYAALAQYATDEKQAKHLEKLTTKAGAKEFKERVAAYTTYADLLFEFDSAHPSMADLVDLIPAIKPRHYSIASSQRMRPDSVQLLVVLVDWQTPNGETRYGQCTRYLSTLQVGQSVTVEVKPSVMRLPEDPAAPVIMAGLGTGLAPFRAFIEERAMLSAEGITVGPMSLYFGSRSRYTEFLYGDELEAYNRMGLLTHLRCAFSRDGPEKVYIQHKLQEDIKTIHQYLADDEGTFYLCGPTWPAGDVQDAITRAYVEIGGETPQDAAESIRQLKEHERYILEVY